MFGFGWKSYNKYIEISKGRHFYFWMGLSPNPNKFWLSIGRLKITIDWRKTKPKTEVIKNAHES